MKKDNNVFMKIGIGASVLGLFIGGLAGTTIVKIKNNKDIEKWKKYDKSVIGDNIRYFALTEEGVVQKMVLDGEPIPVVIKDMDELSKRYVIDGINTLDNISEKINYNIYDEKDFDTKKNKKYISIEMCDKIEEHVGGRTYYTYDKYSGEIAFPITIKLDKKFADCYWNEDYTQSVLTTIVQHELLHTLGFTDLYDKNEQKNTVMFYNIDGNSVPDYTQRDKNIISQVYDGKEIYDLNENNETASPVSYYYDAKNNVVNCIHQNSNRLMASDTLKNRETTQKYFKSNTKSKENDGMER